MDTLIPISDIRIDEEGVWFYRSVEMSRQDIVRLFYQHLVQDTSGCYYIEIGKQRYRIEVADTAYVVLSVAWEGGNSETGECAYLLLSDGSIDKLDPGTLRIGNDNILYCSIQNHRFEARFSRSAYYQIANHISHDSSRDSYFILLNGNKHYISGIPGV